MTHAVESKFRIWSPWWWSSVAELVILWSNHTKKLQGGLPLWVRDRIKDLRKGLDVVKDRGWSEEVPVEDQDEDLSGWSSGAKVTCR